MKLILVLDLPSVTVDRGPVLAQQFVDALVASPANDDAIIYTVTSMIPTTQE